MKKQVKPAPVGPNSNKMPHLLPIRPNISFGNSKYDV